jgi:hypothetical protein
MFLKTILVSVFMFLSFGALAEDMEASNGRDSVLSRTCESR